MAEDRNDVSRFGGEYMVQDRDHMSEIDQAPAKVSRGGVRQAEQSQAGSRQQGGDHGAGGQQGGERRRQAQ